MPAPTAHRRAEPRHRCSRWHFVLLVHWPALQASWAVLRDRSPRGLGLLADQPFPVGTILTAQLQAGQPPAAVGLAVEVRHATPQPDGNWLVGCRLARPLRADELLTLP
jgi:hypothetical protein